MPGHRLVIAGASVRAAAFSAIRAGFEPICIDLFADRDLRARCLVEAVNRATYPNNLADAIGRAPPAPWMYTGGLENHPKLIRRISADRPLWGNDAGSLRLARDPLHIARLLQEAGLSTPKVSLERPSASSGARWLIKRRAGAGGAGIRFWSPQSRIGRGQILQEYVEGPSLAAIYVGLDDSARLLGVTRQLVGENQFHAPPFSYCGSIGPMVLEAAAQKRLEQVGIVLVRECRLQGLFGVDFILHNAIPYPVEVNPRYTASIEVLEYASGLSALAMHRRAFERDKPDSITQAPARGFIGKGVYFARSPITIPTDGPWQEDSTGRRSIFDVPEFADIPAAGTRIGSGAPVLTFFTCGSTVDECQVQLMHMAKELDAALCRR